MEQMRVCISVATRVPVEVKLLFAGAEPKKVTFPTITNIDQHRTSKLRRVHGLSHQSSYPHVNGWLQVLRAYCDSNQLPTIVVVASYDTFGAAPGFSCLPGELGLKVGLKHKKINISNARLDEIHLGAVRELKEESGARAGVEMALISQVRAGVEKVRAEVSSFHVQLASVGLHRNQRSSVHQSTSLQDLSRTNITAKINLMKLEVNGVNSSTPM
ncbi:uncharacterized protein [Henckelia pumila]|uniref:uncharacterized protein isoform X2 n=1 Tax=Henckelia pumila TaxID=405737 RepID=UPI003C6E642C